VVFGFQTLFPNVPAASFDSFFISVLICYSQFLSDMSTAFMIHYCV
jgi:hypothetical protein